MSATLISRAAAGAERRPAALTEHEYEPVPGLPEPLPPGEEILWQGAPRWEALARRAFHIRKIAAWFALFLVLNLGWDLSSGRDPAAILMGALWLVVAASSAIGLLTLLARAMSRSTLYTITNHRLVMRFGVAIPITINLPFGKILGADLLEHGDGSGDIALRVSPGAQVSYLVLWPHVRPWSFALAQPTLRAIPQAAKAAAILASALRADSSSTLQAPPAPQEAPAPHRAARAAGHPVHAGAPAGTRAPAMALHPRNPGVRAH